MKFVVCIKQVPSLEHMKFDSETKRLIREGVPNNVNTFDRRAISEAVKLKEQLGGEIVVITMGPPQAAEALKEALMMGCDRAVHLLGREFAGSDTLATARALALACRKIGFDLILCGKVATDAETAQVPPMLAEFLDLPQVMSVTELHIAADGKSLTAVRDTDEGFETIECPLPALLSAGERLNRPLRVGPADAPKAEGKAIDVWGADALAAAPAELGASGSPTWVESIYSIEPQRKHIMLDPGDVRAAARQLAAHLKEEGWGTGNWKSRPQAGIRAQDRKPARAGAKAIWVVSEAATGLPAAAEPLRDVTLEMLGAGIRIANQIEGELAALVIGPHTPEQVKQLAAYGADRIYMAEDPSLAQYSTEEYASVLSAAIRQYKPSAVLMGSTANGRDFAPRVAARLGLGLTGDAIGLEVDPQGRIVMLKPAFGGNIVAPILSKTEPALVTIRPGILPVPEADNSRSADVVALATPGLRSRTKVTKQEAVTEEGLALDNAEIIIGVGYGIGGPENLPIIEAFAKRLGAHIAASRKVVDSGWLPRQVQVGLTGRSIAPRLYLTLGLSGQFNHNVGIQRSGVIVAVNSNPDAPIFKQADYGIIADWKEFVEAMSSEVG